MGIIETGQQNEAIQKLFNKKIVSLKRDTICAVLSNGNDLAYKGLQQER